MINILKTQISQKNCIDLAELTQMESQGRADVAVSGSPLSRSRSSVSLSMNPTYVPIYTYIQTHINVKYIYIYTI